MNQSATVVHEVLTLEEAAAYLRLTKEAVERNALKGAIPGRHIDGEWRFSKAGLDDWLRKDDPRRILLRQAGALADDEHMSEMLTKIYEERGRPEAE